MQKKSSLYYIEFYDFTVKYFCLIKIAQTLEIFWLRHCSGVWYSLANVLALLACVWCHGGKHSIHYPSVQATAVTWLVD